MNKLIVLLLLLPSAVYAQTDALSGLEQAGAETGLITSKTPPQMIALVINGLLGLLGTVFTVYIILGGFKWMTSQGNAEQVTEAKKSIVSATIGLTIVVVSYIVARFIIGLLANASGSGGGQPAADGSFE